MAPRRKRGFMDDGLDSSGDSESGGDDFEQEDSEFRPQGFNRKRRRRDEEDSDNDEPEAKPVKRADWTKAPAFVSKGKEEVLEDAMDVDEEGDSSEDEDEDEGEDAVEDSSSDEVEPSKPSPRIREEDEDMEDDQPRMGGIGNRSRMGGIGASKSGLGSKTTPSFAQGGIGSSAAFMSFESHPSEIRASSPSAFGNAQSSSSFVRSTTPKAVPVELSSAEKAHFAKISGGIGARLLAKMGWQAGAGLGASGDGIVAPVESKMRPERSGIAFKGFKERTEQSKMESRRRGEEVSDDESEKVKKAKKKAREVKEKRSDAWKKPKKVKTKIEHKTYEQIIAEAGGDTSASAGIGQIIDATGAVVSNSLANVVPLN
jgi:tuftelin-interacting protein 11